MDASCDLLSRPADVALCHDVKDRGVINSTHLPWASARLGQSDAEPLRDWLALIRARIAADGGDTLAKARRVFESMKAPEAEGGLGLVFDDIGMGHGRDPVEVTRDRSANCIEFVSLFLLAADALGIPAMPIELFEDAQANFVSHVRIGIPALGKNGIAAIADIANGFFGAPPAGEKWAVLTRRQFLAYYYNLKSARNQGSSGSEPYLDLALTINPGNYLLLYNKAYFDAGRGDERRALQDLLGAVADNPRYPLSYGHITNIAQQLGQTQVADWARSQYRKLVGNNP